MASSTKNRASRSREMTSKCQRARRPRRPRARATKSALEHFREYERERPGVVALWCLGHWIRALGWKLKLW